MSNKMFFIMGGERGDGTDSAGHGGHLVIYAAASLHNFRFIQAERFGRHEITRSLVGSSPASAAYPAVLAEAALAFKLAGIAQF